MWLHVFPQFHSPTGSEPKQWNIIRCIKVSCLVYLVHWSLINFLMTFYLRSYILDTQVKRREELSTEYQLVSCVCCGSEQLYEQIISVLFSRSLTEPDKFNPNLTKGLIPGTEWWKEPNGPCSSPQMQDVYLIQLIWRPEKNCNEIRNKTLGGGSLLGGVKDFLVNQQCFSRRRCAKYVVLHVEGYWCVLEKAFWGTP